MELESVLKNSETTQKTGKSRAQWSPYQKPAGSTFWAEEISSVTILHGGLPKTLEMFLSAGIQGMGYRSDHLSVPDNTSLEYGREYCDAGLCNPTYYTVGNLIKHLESLRRSGLSRAEIVKNYLYLTAGSCGPCRFGMYESQYRMALNAAGYPGFRVIVFNVERLPEPTEKEPAMKFDLQFLTVLLEAIFIGDQINELRYLTQPYEVQPGATQQALEKAQEIMIEYFRNHIIWNKTNFPVFPGFFRGGVLETTWRYLKLRYHPQKRRKLEEVRKLFDAIEVDYTRVKPMVKVMGEFWAQSTEGDGNYRLYDFLHQEGCEVRYEPVSALVFFILYNEKLKYLFRPIFRAQRWRKGVLLAVKSTFGGVGLRIAFHGAYQLSRFLARWHYDRIGKLLGNRSGNPDKVKKLAEMAGPYMDIRYEGGEGFLEVGKNIYYTRNKLSHMVMSVKPFGCMPSTISDAVQARVLTDFDDMTFLPLETSGDGKINALSRVQMALGEARQKATEEFHRVLSEYGITHEKFLEIHEKYKIPYHGATNLPWVEGYTLRVSHYIHQLMKKAGMKKVKGGSFARG